MDDSHDRRDEIDDADDWGSSFVKPDPTPNGSSRAGSTPNGSSSRNGAGEEATQNEHQAYDSDAEWGYNVPNGLSYETPDVDGSPDGLSERGVRRGSRGGQKSSYALALQRACKDAAQSVKENNMILNTSWAAPLTTAPYAISIMAVLLKAADQRAAAGLEVESQAVLKDGNIVGKLPSKFFHTNLQHCADVGRLAFRDAQHAMSAINKTAKSLIEDEGSIAYIIDLLEDPEDARHDLKPELEALKEKTTKCLKNAEGIKSKFEYWFLVIMNLKETSLSRKNEVILHRQKTGELRTEADQNKDKYNGEKEALELAVRLAKEQLDEAKLNFIQARDYYDMICREPVDLAHSFWEDVDQEVRRRSPNLPSPKKERGLFTDIKDKLLGQSDAHAKEDKQNFKAYWEEVWKIEEEARNEAQKKHEERCRQAAERVERAKEGEEKMAQQWHNADKKLNDTTCQLASAKSNLVKAEADMKMLENKDAELESIMEILENSAEKLGQLKNLLDPLVTFFDQVQGQIDKVVTNDVQDFLRPIETRLKPGSKEEKEAIRFGNASKKRITTSALHMQGQFSAIADIASAYVSVSSEYIRPAILQMEHLSTLKGAKWDLQSQRFIRWCNDAMSDIDGVARETDRTVVKNVNLYIDALQRRAIEAAADARG